MRVALGSGDDVPGLGQTKRVLQGYSYCKKDTNEGSQREILPESKKAAWQKRALTVTPAYGRIDPISAAK